jgi:hypothetical protein
LSGSELNKAGIIRAAPALLFLPLLTNTPIGATDMHLYQLCYNARRMDRHSEAELWARFKAARPQDACAVTPARPAPHPMPEQIDAALEWAREYLSTM